MIVQVITFQHFASGDEEQSMMFAAIWKMTPSGYSRIIAWCSPEMNSQFIGMKRIKRKSEREREGIAL